jgi:Predicted enzyme related to lactoylglutathione lyase
MKNTFCHVELTTDNPVKAKAFYGKLFSWTFEDAGGDYTMIKTGEDPGGGLMKKPSPQVPTAWLTYVMVESVEATVKKAHKLGGTIIVDKTPIPDMGAFAVLADPTGGVIGVFEPSEG